MTTDTKPLPSALYAAAGAADMAREQIEKLPAKASRISEQVKDGKIKDKAYDLGGRAVGEIAGLGGRAYAEFSSIKEKTSKGLSKEALAAEADRARVAAKRGAGKVTKAFDKLVERGVQVLDGEPRKPVKAEVVVSETAKTTTTTTPAAAPKTDSTAKTGTSATTSTTAKTGTSSTTSTTAKPDTTDTSVPVYTTTTPPDNTTTGSTTGTTEDPKSVAKKVAKKAVNNKPTTSK
ncbi:MAG: hypothetical protein H0T78_06740 [Longispora sp.]|nr:hypothetical protein [Longispora sp. (in: high G+C Gram-positive bacteria)]